MTTKNKAWILAPIWLATALCAAVTDTSGDSYIIGIDDKVMIKIVDLPDIPDKPFRVDPSGCVDLPLLGAVRAAGFTPEEFKAQVRTAASKYISDPDISVNVAEYQSQMVTVIGAVTNPGSHPLAGPKRLLEVLSEAGGLKPDAGSNIKITREIKWGAIPLPDARMDLSGEFSVAELDTDKLVNAGIPRDNIYVRPHDVISVSKAELIYVLGQVKKAGGFPLTSRASVSVLKAVSLAEGWQPNAAPKKSIILRPSADGGPKTEIAVDLDKILSGKAPDVEMRANDILYVPNNVPRSVALADRRSSFASRYWNGGLAVGMNDPGDFDILPAPVRRDPRSGTGLIQESEIWARRLPVEPEPSMAIEYARTFWAHRWLVLGCVLGGSLIAFAFTLTSLPVFRAHTSVEIQGINSNFMNIRAVDPSEQSGNSSDESFVQTQIKLLQSESLVAEVVAKLNSAGGKKVPRQDLLTVWQKQLGKGAGGDLPRKAALQYIADNLKVKPMGLTRLVQVSCDGWDAQLSADFCNTLTQQFIDDGLVARYSAAQKTSEWLKKQVEDIREKLADSETRLQAMHRDNAVYSADKETMAESKLRQLQDEASRADADRITKFTQFQLTTTAPPDTLPMVLDSGPLKEYQMKKTDLARQLAEKSPPLLPTHPEVKHIQAEIAEIDAAIQRERGNVIARAKNEYTSAVQRGQLINEQFAAQQKVVSTQLERNAQIEMLERDVKSTRSLYESLLERTKEAGFVTAMRASTVRVVDPAKTPLIPIAPRRTVTTAIGGSVAALLSLMLAVITQRNDLRIRTPEDVKRQLKIREVGVIPSVHIDRALRPGLLQRLRRVERGKFDLTTWTDRDSLLAEAYRVATNQIFAKRRSYKSAVLVVSSPGVGEGKTTATANLAIALAETRKRVIVVDGDLRNPRLHKSLGVDNGFGLRDVLRVDATLDEQEIGKLIKTTSVPGVSLVPSGSRCEEDSISLLHSPNLPTVIKSLASSYDVVLIDTPPMLNLADARVFCESADGAILVVRANSTTREMAAVAYDGFATVNTPVIGVILNDFDAKREAGYGYYKKYNEYCKSSTA